MSSLPPAFPNTPRRRGAFDPMQRPTWRQRLEALRNVRPLLGMVWETHRGYAVAIVALRLLRAFVPLAVLWIGKLIIDGVVAAMRAHGAGQPVRWEYLGELLVTGAAIAVVGDALARAGTLVESLLGDLFSNRISVRLMEHAATLDLRHYEDSEFYDHLERARRQTVGRIGLIALLLSSLQDLITLASLAATLVFYVPWLLVLLALAVLPSFLGETHFAALGYSLLYRWTPERRQLDYLRFTAASDETAKEIKLFGLSRWLTDRYAKLADAFYEANRKLSIRHSAVSTLLTTIGTRGLLRRLRRDHLPHGRRLPLARGPVHDRRADVPGGLLPAESRPDPARAALDVADLRAEPLPGGPVHLLRDAAQHRLARRGPAGAQSDPRGVRVPRRRVPLPGERRVGGAAPDLPARRGRAAGAGGRERRGEDDADQAAGAAVRSGRGRASSWTVWTCGTTTSRACTATSA